MNAVYDGPVPRWKAHLRWYWHRLMRHKTFMFVDPATEALPGMGVVGYIDRKGVTHIERFFDPEGW